MRLQFCHWSIYHPDRPMHKIPLSSRRIELHAGNLRRILSWGLLLRGVAAGSIASSNQPVFAMYCLLSHHLILVVSSFYVFVRKKILTVA